MTIRQTSCFIAAMAMSTSAFAGAPTVVANYTLLKSHGSAVPVADGLGGYIGPAVGGGTGTSGAIVRFVPGAAGQPWAESVAYAFTGGTDGVYPQGRLMSDGNGGFVGVTLSGGSTNNGTVFRLAPPAMPGSAWTHSVIYNFQGGGSDTAHPHGDLYPAQGGSFYGLSSGVSGSAGGAVFQLTPPAAPGGAWTESVIYTFAPTASSGAPVGLAKDPQGNLYLTLAAVKRANRGQVVQLVPPAVAGSNWTMNVLHTFALHSGTGDAAYPNGISYAANGVLYGVATFGGVNNQGAVFALTNTGGNWVETIAYSFAGGATDGAQPVGKPGDDGTGGFFVTASNGGPANDGALIDFKIGVAGLTEGTVFNFLGAGAGKNPRGAPIALGGGVFLGATLGGGSKNSGTLYEVTP